MRTSVIPIVLSQTKQALLASITSRRAAMSPNAVPSYRPATDVEAAKPGLDGLQRAERTITCSYIVGWNDPGRMAELHSRLHKQHSLQRLCAHLFRRGRTEAIEFAHITSDAGQSNQTKQVVGEFRSPPTGNWDIFHHVPLTDPCGRIMSLRLFGTNTFRLTACPGNFDINYFIEARR
jgi:hypothetical protein